MSYDGIKKEIDKNGNPRIIVRFRYKAKMYNEKNFTKLFGITTEKKANDKLQEIKVEISKGNNPFLDSKETLNELWDERYEQKVKNGEWSKNTARNYRVHYNAHVREVIGWKKISKITYDDLEIIYNNLSGNKGGSKNIIKRMLNGLFDNCIIKGLITKNIILDLKTQKAGKIKNIEEITGEDYLSIVRKLYNQISVFEIKNNSGIKSAEQAHEFRMFLTMCLLTAHRYGEIIELKKENVILEENKIISPASITKTKEEYHFPIPPACREYIQSIESGLIFPTVMKGSVYHLFRRLVKETDIKFYNGKALSAHDTRRLMLKVMITDCGIDSMLADSCLNHKQKGAIKHYIHFSYKDRAKAYELYWKKIAGTEEVIEEGKINLEDLSEDLQKTIKNLIKMESMKRQGLL
jgi:integrase